MYLVRALANVRKIIKERNCLTREHRLLVPQLSMLIKWSGNRRPAKARKCTPKFV